jgi:hypothetical protein
MCDEKKDRVVAATNGCSSIATLQKAFNLFGFDILRNLG